MDSLISLHPLTPIKFLLMSRIFTDLFKQRPWAIVRAPFTPIWLPAKQRVWILHCFEDKIMERGCLTSLFSVWSSLTPTSIRPSSYILVCPLWWILSKNMIVFLSEIWHCSIWSILIFYRLMIRSASCITVVCLKEFFWLIIWIRPSF